METTQKHTCAELICKGTPAVTTWVTTSLNVKQKVEIEGFASSLKEPIKTSEMKQNLASCSITLGTKQSCKPPTQSQVLALEKNNLSTASLSYFPVKSGLRQWQNVINIIVKQELKGLNYQTNMDSVIDNNTSFPSQTATKEDNAPRVHLIFILMQARPPSANPTKDGRLRRTRNNNANWTCQAEAVTEKPNGALLTSAREFSSPGTPKKREGELLTACSVSGAQRVLKLVHLRPGSSGATAVLLGAHQHFAVQLLLFFFEGVFYFSSFQTSVPRKKKV